LASECAEKQLGWWHYRWCHLQSVRQFHLEKDGTMSAEASLGVFDETASNSMNAKRRKREQNKRNAAQKNNLNKGSGNSVVDREKYSHLFTNGDVCQETKKRRRTEVRFKCCDSGRSTVLSSASSASTSSGSAGTTIRNEASIQSIQEPTTCSYLITVCTRHACRKGDKISGGRADSGGGDGGSTGNPSQSSSITSLLKPLKGSCFRLMDGWWTYEFCSGAYLRQMHIQVKEENKKGAQVQEVQSMYELGKWSGKAILAAEEHEHIVHLPSLHADHVVGGSVGTAVAFSEEYGGGGMCELTGKPRSTTVHFVCRGGSGLASRILSVKEDSSCHYHLEFHSAHLCMHPLFSEKRATATTIQCVEEEEEEEEEEKPESHP
jgi:hypothetical protein